MHLTGLVDLRSSIKMLLLYAGDGALVASININDGIDCRIGLVDLARSLVTSYAKNVDTFIFITASIVDAPLQIECIACRPCLIYRVSTLAAAIHANTDDCGKLQILDYETKTWWLLNQTVGQIESASLQRGNVPIREKLSQLVEFGYRSILLVGNACSDALALADLSIKHIDCDDLYQGARRAVQECHRIDGCYLVQDSAHRKVLTLRTKQSVGYEITQVTRSVFSLAEQTLAEVASDRPVFLVVDKNVDRIYGSAIDRYAALKMNCAGKLIFEATETNKNGQWVARIGRAAVQCAFPRHGLFVAIGGGVTLDVVGLVASLYCRGAGYVRIPTTLVGLIDAGLGIKQAVNFSDKKNHMGAFYPPLAVINDPHFLGTLPHAEVSCGLAEIIKIALVKDSELFELLVKYAGKLHGSRFSEPKDIAEEVLIRASMLMLTELEPNLYESNTQRIVDYGHTFSPTIEALSGYTIPHGRAVAMDMLLSTALAVHRRLCSKSLLRTLRAVFEDCQLPITLPRFSVEELVSALVATRQRRRGELNLVVPTAIGRCVFVQDVSPQEIAQALVLIDELDRSQSRPLQSDVAVAPFKAAQCFEAHRCQ